MSMKEIVDQFTKADDSALRATFEAAMTQHIEDEGLTFKDVLFDIYRLQVDVAKIKEALSTQPKAD